MTTRIAELCAPLHPRVIHLMGDQDRIARASIVERGDKWEKQLIDQSNAAPYQKAPWPLWCRGCHHLSPGNARADG